MATARVLIVDDEPAILRMVSKALKDRYSVLSASGPQRALEIVKAIQIELVLSNVEMPGMRGPDLLNEINKISPSTAGLLMSGTEEAAAGMPILKKPFSSEELRASVEAALAHALKLNADLTNTLGKTTELVEHASRLKCELSETLCESAEILEKTRSLHEAQKAADTIICAFCSAALSATASFCNQCRKPIGLHTIVRDGHAFGIALNGKIILHGLGLKKAQELASLLNSIK